MTADFGQIESKIGTYRISMLAYSLRARQHDQLHSHDYHQIVTSKQPGVNLSLGRERICLPVSTGLFIPGGVRHALAANRQSVVQCIYFRAAVPTFSVRAVAFNGLLKELISEIFETDRAATSRLLMAFCLYDQIGALLWHNTKPFEMLTKSLSRACMIVQSDPAADLSIAELAVRVGLSERSLRRAAATELGFSMSQFRTMCRIFRACQLLQAGIPIASALSTVGYASESAFFTAFKRVMGVTPKRFLNSAPNAPIRVVA